MKLILASNLGFVLKYGYDLTGIPKDKIKIGYITTASKGASSSDYVEALKIRIKEAGKVLKSAKLATGYELQVPLFCSTGDKIEIDTRTGEYRSRAN